LSSLGDRRYLGFVVTLRARIYRVTMIRWIDIPRAALAGLDLPAAESKGAAKGWKAVLRFNGDIDRVTLLPGKRGKYKMALKVELLRVAGVDAGDTIEFSLEPDSASREPELPEAMRRAFQLRPKLAEAWAAESVARKRQVVRYIFQAKTPETQDKRSWIFIERLAEMGKLSAT
jgi:hypothetical protein